MFLSRVELRGASCDRYQLHRHIWPLFGHADRSDRPFVFRVLNSTRERMEVRVASEIQPHEAPRARLLSVQRIALNDFSPGQPLSFAVSAAPTRCLTSASPRARGRVVAIVNKDEQLDWLRLKLKSAADVTAAEVLDARRISFTKRGIPGSFLEVRYKGECTVRDVAEFSGLLLCGIGRHKAFGLGLVDVFQDFQDRLEPIQSRGE